MADRADIDRIRETVDLVDLISEVTKVKKSGRTFMAVCPFHEEKTPSMSIDRARGLYHCFGCGKGGDVFSFVQETQGLDFRESLELLARKAGVTLTEDPGAAQRRGRRGAAIEALRRAIDVYHTRLKSAPDAGPARAYLRSRGYDVDVIDKWKVGFAGTDWDTLTKELRAGGVADRALTDAGLSRRGRHGHYDFFRGRLMFPIHDLRGDPVGFGGRKIEEVARESTNNPDAKYVNSPDSVVYQKSRLLYGLDRARQAMGSAGEAVIVEGYTDVIAMHLAGVETAVATCGTALGDGHFDLLRRFTEKVVLAFDSDAAGSKAALRSDDLESPFRLDLDLRVALMPDGLDPADLVQEGRGDELSKAIEAARPLLEFRIQSEISEFDVSEPEGKMRALMAVSGPLSRIRSPVLRRDYAQVAARAIGGLEAGDVLNTIDSGSVPASVRPLDPDSPLNKSEVGLLRFAIQNPGEVGDLQPTDFNDTRLRSAYEALEVQITGAEVGDQVDLSVVREPSIAAVVRQVVMDRTPPPSKSDVLDQLRRRRLYSEIDRLESEIAGMEAGTQPHSDALRRLIGLQKQKRSVQGQ